MRIIQHRSIPSTNTAASELAEQGSPEWTVVISDVQTQGRGRSGRKWESSKGGLWCSILLRPQVRSSSVSVLQFLAANATRQTVETLTGLKPQFKWPNDLLLEARKLGGILLEAKIIGDRVSYVIIGIGLNVNQPQELVPLGGTSLRTVSGSNYDLRGLLSSILKQARSRYEQLNEPEKIMQEWWDNCIHRLRPVHVDLPGGAITGIAKGLDLQGSLLIETQNNKMETVSEGSLRVLEP